MERKMERDTVSNRLIPPRDEQESPPAAMTYARQTVLEALDLLEKENHDIRSLNSKILNELDELRQENEQLRREAEDFRNDRQDTEQRLQMLSEDNENLKVEIQRQMDVFAQKDRRRAEVEQMLKAENVKSERAVQDMNSQIAVKEDEIAKISKELYAVRDQLERNDRRYATEQDIELLHEIEMLKTEKTEIFHEKQSVEKTNNKLRNELRNLEAQLEERKLELKNENRRHSLLTKEFNSLLEENSHLKLQLRRRPGAAGGTTAAAAAAKDTVTSEGIVPLNIPADALRSATPRQTPRVGVPPTREKTTIGLSPDFSRHAVRAAHRSRETSSLLAVETGTASSDELNNHGSSSSSNMRSTRAFLDTLPSRSSTRAEDDSSPETLPSLVGSSKKWRP